jgi:addiction module HigA family antidote
VKTTRFRQPVHPRTILKLDLLEPLKISINEVVKELHVPANRLSQIVRGRRGITHDTLMRPARYFGFTPEYWLIMQLHYDLQTNNASPINAGNRERSTRVRRCSLPAHKVMSWECQEIRLANPMAALLEEDG